MVAKSKTLSTVTLYGLNSINKDALDKFYDNFNDTYNHLYVTSNWNDLKCFINDSFLTFESIITCEYSLLAESFLINNFNALSRLNTSTYVGFSLDSKPPNEELLYSNIVLNLILTSNVKVHNNDSELGVTELDSLVTRYSIYTNLYLSLVDVYIKMYEFDAAVENLIQLGIVQHYLRIEFSAVIHGFRGIIMQKYQDNINELYEALDRKGIYMSPPSEESVINQVIDYWKARTDFEIWSRLIKIYFNIDSIYNSLIKLESLPLPVRMKIFFSVNFYLSDLPIRKILPPDIQRFSDLSSELEFKEDENEDLTLVDISDTQNAVFSYLKDGRTMEEIMGRISRTHVISHIFTTGFNFQCFFIEGLLFFCHLCRDFYHDLFKLTYSILYDSLQVFISINNYYHHQRKKEITNKVMYACMGCFKVAANHFNFIPPVLQLVSNQYRLEKKLDAVAPDTLVPKFHKKSSVTRRFSNPILGFNKVSTLTKADLEYNFLFHATNSLNYLPVYYEYFTILPNTATNRSPHPVEFNLNFKGFQFPLRNRTHNQDSNLGRLFINGVEISNFNKSQEIYNPIHFIRSLYDLQSNVKIKNIGRTRYSSEDYDLSFRHLEEGNWVIRRFPDSVLSVIISTCFLIDDIYVSIHYSQSLEYLQYTDTLKSKNRAIFQTLLPFVPKRSSKDAKKIISFQKHIRKKFTATLMSSRKLIPFPNIKKAYSRVLKLIFRKDPKPSVEIYVKNDKEPTDKIAFKISSVRKNDNSHISLYRGHRASHKNTVFTGGSFITNIETKDFQNKTNVKRTKGKQTSDMASFLNSHLTGENIDNNRFFGSDSKCIHLSLGSTFKECDFCDRLNNFRHLSHLLYLIDLLAHYMFTLNLSCSLDFSIYLSEDSGTFTEPSTGIDEGYTSRSSGQDLPYGFSEIMSQIDKSFYFKSCSYYNKNDHPFTILKEVIENTILLSMSTVFHEDYYNHLISRLAIYHLIKGRFNMTLSLLKQTLAESNTYKIDYGVSEFHMEENYLCDIDRPFKIQLASKIYLELLNDLYSFRKLNNITKDTNFDPDPEKVDSETVEEYYMRYRLCLMTGFSYLREAHSKLMNSVSIFDTSFRKMTSSLFPTTNQRCFFPKPQGADSLDWSDGDDYRLTMKLASETLLKAVTLDPQDYKSWYYLAQCSLFSNDLHFAYNCCERSIQCFDSCIASRLTKVICNSTKVRTCSSFYVDDDLWRSYLNRRSFEDSVSFKSIPSPLEPLFPPPIENSEDMENHFERFVGEDLENCLTTLKSLQKFDNIYVSSCILLLLTRIHRKFNPFFPWEVHYLWEYPYFFGPPITSSFDKHGTQILITETRHADFVNNVKKMVTSSIEANYLLCVVPFMNLIMGMFLNTQFNFKCTHHSNKPYSYNSSGLSMNFLDEEVYGWLTCIEVLCHIGQSDAAQQLLPILDLYMEYYSIDKYYKKRSDKNVCKISHANRNKRKMVQRYFGMDSFLGTDVFKEITYMNFYVKCYNTSGSKESMRELVKEAERLNNKYQYRKFSLLQTRLFTGRKQYNECVQLSNQLHRGSLKICQHTDFDLEYRSMLAFAHSLSKIGENEKSKEVDTFAKQIHLTSPIIKLDLCLNIPL